MNVNSNERKDYYDVDDICNMFCIICQPVLLYIFLSCCRNGRDWFSYEDNVHSCGETTNHAKATIINDADYKGMHNRKYLSNTSSICCIHGWKCIIIMTANKHHFRKNALKKKERGKKNP
uniref:Uncharacterized protein n=1 Tax=Glossina palpalis gambiensis TaxID=67801 RepID=A0A1B0B0B1_9MUSC